MTYPSVPFLLLDTTDAHMDVRMFWKVYGGIPLNSSVLELTQAPTTKEEKSVVAYS